MNKVKNLVRSLVASDAVRRVLHSFWQAAGGVLLAGVFAAHSSGDVKALVIAACAAGLAAVKALVVSRS